MSAQKRAEWAAKIDAAWRKSVEAILECSNHLQAARVELGDAEFWKMVTHELQIGRRTAQRLLIVASDSRLATHVSLLPAAWSTLYALAHVPDEAFVQAIADGVICPSMTRRDAEALVPRLKPQPKPQPPRPKTVAVWVETPPVADKPPRTMEVFCYAPNKPSAPEQTFPPGQTPPPEHPHERAVADALAKLAALISSCNVAELAALLRDRPVWLEQAERVGHFMRQLELALGGASGALH